MYTVADGDECSVEEIRVGGKGGTCWCVQDGQGGLVEKVTFEQRPERGEERNGAVIGVGRAF